MIVDAGVAVKWLIDEDGSAEALLLLEGSALQAPDLLFAEVANVIWKRWRRGEFTQLPIGLYTLPRMFGTVDSLATLLPRAVALAVELDHPAYDCCYLAMALERDDVLVTADAKFLRICTASRYAGNVRSLT